MKRIQKIISLLGRILYFTLLISLLLSYIAPYVNPKGFWLLAFFGLAYPLLLVSNTVFLLWWMLRRKKLFWLSLICILAGWTSIQHFFNFIPNSFPLRCNVNSVHLSTEESRQKEEIKILTYNVRLFDLYNWTRNKDTRFNIYSFIKKESADICCFQEFFQSDSGKYNTLDTLIELTQSTAHHVAYTVTRKKKNHWGLATFSKYPILNRGEIIFKTPSNNSCIFSDLKIGTDTVRIYNLHLQSISFGYADYKFIDALKENNDTLDAEDIEIASKNILRRLKRAFIKRASQSEMVLDHIKTCNYPVIVCGDFNDTPFSYTYHAFSKKLRDSFMESGSGIGNTYLGDFPSYRIDYVFHSNNFCASRFEVFKTGLSDHYPVICHLLSQTPY
jgi:endonuclease/exonuclease/phosphatase family metal-dependent hydrolase